MAKKIDPMKAKQAKQKKIAIGGAVLLVLLLAFEVPKVMKKMHGPPPPAWRTAVPTTPTATGAPTGLAAPTLSGGNPTPVVASTPGGPLAAEMAPTAAVGQLASLGRFASKDPFASQAPTTTPTATTPPTPPTPPTTSTDSSIPGASGGSTGAGGTNPAAPAVSLTSAVIAVNKVQSLVQVNTDFPASTDASVTPMFHLVSLTAHTAKVSIAGGSYADGAPTITLQERKPVTLMNTADGTRYTLELYPQGTPVAATTTGTGTTPSAPILAPAPATTGSTGATTTAPTTTKSGG
jgi:hypothetical protein